MSKNGVEELSAQLSKICADLERGEGLKEATRFVQSAARMGVLKDSGYLRNNIFMDIEREGSQAVGTVYTNVSYGTYVELGTGPKGEADHDGISPEVTPVYKTNPWWIHESDLDVGVAERYHWPHIDTPEGRFYKCNGQPAHPFLYPALKDNEEDVIRIIDEELEKTLKRYTK